MRALVVTRLEISINKRVAWFDGSWNASFRAIPPGCLRMSATKAHARRKVSERAAHDPLLIAS
ncbi:MAG: hypothetical protein ACK6DC_20665, partial [Planctomycetota bacterium]